MAICTFSGVRVGAASKMASSIFWLWGKPQNVLLVENTGCDFPSFVLCIFFANMMTMVVLSKESSSYAQISLTLPRILKYVYQHFVLLNRVATLPSFIAATAKVGHQLTMPSLRGNRWAVKLGLLEDDSSELAMF